jgi:hypothetical protein
MKEIKNNVYYVGVNDRNKALFEGLWPLPEGVSYNSYLETWRRLAGKDEGGCHGGKHVVFPHKGRSKAQKCKAY